MELHFLLTINENGMLVLFIRHRKGLAVTPIEERVSRLEHAVFGAKAEPARDDWQRTVGMFRGDPVMREIIDDV